jgi:hypothetical protein
VAGWIIAALVLLAVLVDLASKADGGESDFETESPDTGEVGLSIPKTKIVDTGDANGLNLVNLRAMAQGVWKTEGTGATDLAQRNNNPGNLKYAGQPGAVPDSRGFAVFATFADGWAALQRQLLKYGSDHPDWTLLQTMRHYLGMDATGSINVTNQGNALKKAQDVAGAIGGSVTENTTLRDILGV